MGDVGREEAFGPARHAVGLGQEPPGEQLVVRRHLPVHDVLGQDMFAETERGETTVTARSRLRGPRRAPEAAPRDPLGRAEGAGPAGPWGNDSSGGWRRTSGGCGTPVGVGVALPEGGEDLVPGPFEDAQAGAVLPHGLGLRAAPPRPFRPAPAGRPPCGPYPRRALPPLSHALPLRAPPRTYFRRKPRPLAPPLPPRRPRPAPARREDERAAGGRQSGAAGPGGRGQEQPGGALRAPPLPRRALPEREDPRGGCGPTVPSASPGGPRVGCPRASPPCAPVPPLPLRVPGPFPLGWVPAVSPRLRSPHAPLYTPISPMSPCRPRSVSRTSVGRMSPMPLCRPPRVP